MFKRFKEALNDDYTELLNKEVDLITKKEDYNKQLKEVTEKVDFINKKIKENENELNKINSEKRQMNRFYKIINKHINKKIDYYDIVEDKNLLCDYLELFHNAITIYLENEVNNYSYDIGCLCMNRLYDTLNELDNIKKGDK